MTDETKKQLPPTKSGQVEIKSGMLVRIQQKIKELDPDGKLKEKIQAFEGMVIARRGGNTPGATFTVRKIGADGVGIEKIYPLHSPIIVSIEVLKKYKVRRAQLYYLKNYFKKLKEIK